MDLERSSGRLLLPHLRHILSLPRRLRLLLRRRTATRKPIIFDFIRGRAYRTSSPRDLAEVMKKRVRKTRVVKTVEGIPPGVIKTKS
jgi:hypothetical protein